MALIKPKIAEKGQDLMSRIVSYRRQIGFDLTDAFLADLGQIRVAAVLK